VSPVVGLYAAPAALILYAAFGSSRHLVTGPMAATAALSAAAVGDLATSGSDAFLQLTVTLGIVTGILAVVAGLLRLGFLANFISEPVLKGFIIGLALTIIVGQLPKLFGIEKGSGNFFEQAWDFLTKLGDTSGLTLLVGVLSLAIVLGLREYARVVPGSLAAVLLGILAVKLFDLDHDGVAIVGSIDSGLPALGLFVLLLYRASRPHVAVLGRVPGSDEAYADVERRPEKETIPGIVILRVESGLFFGNAEPVRKAVRRHAAESGHVSWYWTARRFHSSTCRRRRCSSSWRRI
jgi:MFS superfamily sulfate permease-like transporter